MSQRDDVKWLVEQDKRVDLDELIAEDPRAVRYVLSLTYRPEPEIRARAARGIGVAARHHPDLVEQIVRRLIWAMNDESGTNALTVPEVLQAVADERPDLLVSFVPDLTRLAADEGLKEGLTGVLETVVTRCPGSVGRSIQDSLNKRLRKAARKRKDHGSGWRKG